MGARILAPAYQLNLHLGMSLPHLDRLEFFEAALSTKVTRRDGSFKR